MPPLARNPEKTLENRSTGFGARNRPPSHPPRVTRQPDINHGARSSSVGTGRPTTLR
jgi:hypothetical protein